MIMVNDENKQMKTVMHLLPVKNNSVTTLEEIYGRFNRNSTQSQIHLFRIPVTDEQAPLAKTIDQLIQIAFSNYKDTFVFNCQIGRGRTTTGMIICCMALAFKRGEWHNKSSKLHWETSPTATNYLTIPEDKSGRLLSGFYNSVSELVRMMRSGMKSKYKLDYIIDHNSEMQNIREVIYHYHVGLWFVNGLSVLIPRFARLFQRQHPRRKRSYSLVQLTSSIAIACCLFWRNTLKAIFPMRRTRPSPNGSMIIPNTQLS